MNGKEVFTVWTPTGSSGTSKWTKFVKPALFVHINEFKFYGNSINVPNVPAELAELCDDNTAIIADLPGAFGVENGLALAKHGYIPIPLYNGIHEKNIGELKEAVDNAPIVDALATGADFLRRIEIKYTAPPVFLLDYNREKEIADSHDIYDNRWSIDIDDMPDEKYMTSSGISRVIVWTAGEMRKDLQPIADSYHDAGIEVITFNNGQAVFYEPQPTNTQSSPSATAEAKLLQENIRKFENARFGLMLITLMAFINLFFMFFVWEEPLVWTAPTVMWLTYLWVPEIVGDVIAVALSFGYLALYLLSQKRRNLMVTALIVFGVETAVLYIYALQYGVAAYTGYSMPYGLLVFGLPLAFLTPLIMGAVSQDKLKDVHDIEYFASLDRLDETYDAPGTHIHVRRRRHFRGFRGYGGYGGSGRGGYSGGGYRGYGGGFGGGFGG